MQADVPTSAPAVTGETDRVRTPEPAPVPAPSLPGSWLLHVAAGVAVVATAIGRIVAPGLRGNASDSVVFTWDRVAAIAAYALACALLAVAGRGLYELSRRTRVSMGVRISLICGVAMVLALVIPSFWRRLPMAPAVALALTASMVAITGAIQGLRAPHTRAVGGVLGLLAAASFVRLGAWELAVVAGEHASSRLYGWSRGIATVAVVLEGLGQLAAAAWLGTRSRVVGQLLSTLAVVCAFVLTWGAARGVHGGAERWQAVLHTALADAAGLPPPYGLGAIATFLTSASILFAGVALAQRRQLQTVTSALALALLANGSFDAPLRALAAVVASVWLILAMSDDRSMWKALTTR